MTERQGIAAAVGGWSVRHRVVAVVGWLAFVALAMLIGSVSEQQQMTRSARDEPLRQAETERTQAPRDQIRAVATRGKCGRRQRMRLESRHVALCAAPCDIVVRAGAPAFIGPCGGSHMNVHVEPHGM